MGSNIDRLPETETYAVIQIVDERGLEFVKPDIWTPRISSHPEMSNFTSPTAKPGVYPGLIKGTYHSAHNGYMTNLSQT